MQKLYHKAFHRSCSSASRLPRRLCKTRTPNLRTKIMDFRGFDSSIILNLRGETLMSIGVGSSVLLLLELLFCVAPAPPAPQAAPDFCQCGQSPYIYIYI